MNALKYFSLQSVLIGLLLLAGCSKNEQRVDEAVFTAISLKLITVDDFFLTAISNDEVLTGQATAPNASGFPFSVQYFDPRHRMRLINNFTGQVVADTVITYRTGYTNPITFFQPASGAPIKWLGPPVNEPAPSAGNGKISIIYTYDLLPDMVKVVVENKVGNNYVATDNFLLKKGEFSRYFEGKNTGDGPVLKLYTTTLPEKLVASTPVGNFINMNPDFTIYHYEGSASCGSCVKDIRGDKLY